MNKQEIEAHLLLSELPHVGEKTLLRLLRLARERSLDPVGLLRLAADRLRREWGLRAATVEFLQRHAAEHRQRCQWLAHQFVEHGGWGATFLDPDFPERLRERLSPPAAMLFASGSPRLLNRPAYALLHSREPNSETLPAFATLVRAFAPYGFALVSSSHKATYRLAATLARCEGSPVLFVLDRGLLHVLGPQLDRDPLSGSRAERNCAEHTLALSTFRLFDHGVARSGRRRDQIVAALADVLVVVHARPGGFMERLALHAIERGQPVFTWRGQNPALLAAGAASMSAQEAAATAARLAASFPSAANG